MNQTTRDILRALDPPRTKSPAARNAYYFGARHAIADLHDNPYVEPSTAARRTSTTRACERWWQAGHDAAMNMMS